MIKKLKKIMDSKKIRIVTEVGIVEPWKEKHYEELFKNSNLRISRERAFSLLQFLKMAADLKGDVAEMGVYKGSTAYLMAETLKKEGKKDKKLFLFDTFEGTPRMKSGYENDNRERAGQYADTSLEQVEKFLQPFQENVRMLKGLVPDTFADIPDSTKFCFIHVHLNLYSSTKMALEGIENKVVDGGIIFVEDYGLKTCAGVKEAVDEYCQTHHKRFLYLTTGQGVIFI